MGLKFENGNKIIISRLRSYFEQSVYLSNIRSDGGGMLLNWRVGQKARGIKIALNITFPAMLISSNVFGLNG